MMRNIIAVIMILPQVLFGQHIFSSISEDFKMGIITDEEFLANRALAIYAPDNLPHKYATTYKRELPLKSGTLLIAELKAKWHQLTEQHQRLLKESVVRPDLPFSIISPSGHFRIHYQTVGVGAVDNSDDNANGIPDYVDDVAAIFDAVHLYQTDSLGYLAPPKDDGIDGDEFDIYIKEFYRSLYGQTTPENQLPDNPEAYTSYIEIDNDYYGYPTSDLNGLKVTAAHEYFHAIHMGYKFTYEDDFWENDVFYYEISSTWMEDVIFDEINDYYFYMNNFFDNINKPFTTYDGSFEYGNCLWNHMLSKKYGNIIIRKIWEYIPQFTVMQSIDRALSQFQSDFLKEFSDYSVWNYFTGTRTDTMKYYDEGAFYPEVRFKVNHIFRSDTTINSQSRQLAYSYFNFYEPKFQNKVTLVPVNLEMSTDLRKNFTYQLKQSERDSFKTIAEEFYLRFQNDNPLAWKTNVIIENAIGETSVYDYDAIDDSMSQYVDNITSYGPNPLNLNEYLEFNIFYELKKGSPVEFTIFSENGKKIKEFSEPMKPRGKNRFTWYLSGEKDFTGGSGIYLLLFKTRLSQKLIKFAVIR